MEGDSNAREVSFALDTSITDLDSSFMSTTSRRQSIGKRNRRQSEIDCETRRLKIKLTNHENQLNFAETQIDTLKTELATTSQKLQSSKQAELEAKRKLQQAESQVLRAEVELQHMSDRLQSFATRNDSRLKGRSSSAMPSRALQARPALASLQRLFVEKGKQLTEVEEQLADAIKQADEMRTNYTHMEQALEHEKERADALDEYGATTTKELEHLQGRMDRLRDKHDAAEREAKALGDEVAALQQAAVAHQANLDDALRARAEALSELAAVQLQANDFQNQVLELSRQLENQTAAMSQVQATLESQLHDSKQAYSSCATELEQCQQELAAARNAQTELAQNVQAVEVERERVAAELAQLATTNTTLREEVAALKATEAWLREAGALAQPFTEQAQKERQAKEDELRLLHDQLLQMKKQQGQLNKEIARLEVAVASERESQQVAADTIAQLTRRVNALQAEQQDLFAANEELHSARDALEAQLHDARSINDAQAKVELDEHLRATAEQTHSLTAELEKLSMALAAKTAEAKSLEEQLVEQKTIVKEHADAIDSIHHSSSTRVVELERALAKSTSTIKKLTQAKNASGEQLSSMTEQMAQVQADAKEATAQLKLQQDLRYNLSILEAKHKQMQKLNSDLEAELQAEKNAMAELRQQLKSAQAENASLETRRAESDAATSNLQLQLKASESRNQALAQQLGELQDRLAATPVVSSPVVADDLPAETADNAGLLSRIRRLQGILAESVSSSADSGADSSMDSDNSNPKRKIRLMQQLKQEIVELQNENKELRAMAKRPSPQLTAPVQTVGKENAGGCVAIITRSKRPNTSSAKSDPSLVTKPTTRGKTSRKPLNAIEANKRVKHI